MLKYPDGFTTTTNRSPTPMTRSTKPVSPFTTHRTLELAFAFAAITARKRGTQCVFLFGATKRSAKIMTGDRAEVSTLTNQVACTPTTVLSEKTRVIKMLADVDAPINLGAYDRNRAPVEPVKPKVEADTRDAITQLLSWE